MPIESRAIVFTAPRQVEVTTLELPDPEPGDLLVRTLYSGLSAGTELWTLTGQYWSTKFPTIPGYQKVGVVEHVGEAAGDWQVGDVVFQTFTRVLPGTNVEFGGHTEYSVVAGDQETMFKLPTGLDPVVGSQLVLAAVGYRGAAEVMPIEPGESVAVIGLGLVGQFAAQIARLRGAKVIGVDLLDSRLDMAAKHAGAVAVNSSKQDAAKVIAEHYPDGLDAVIDTSAHAPTVNASFHWLRHGGRYCFQGYYPGETSLDLLEPHVKELVMYNPTSVTAEGLKQCAQHLADGKMHGRELISHVVPVADAPRMYDTLLNRRAEAMGVVFDWR